MKGNSARQLAGYVLAASAVVACPCHLALTLPLLLALVGGTALGGVLTQHSGLVLGAATVYFLAAAAGAYTLLSSKSHAQGARSRQRGALHSSAPGFSWTPVWGHDAPARRCP